MFFLVPRLLAEMGIMWMVSPLCVLQSSMGVDYHISVEDKKNATTHNTSSYIIKKIK
jgi:hypothetical protein